MGFTASKAAVLAMLAQWPQVTAVLIEDKANGPGGARRPARGGAGVDSGFAGRLEGRPRLRSDAAVGRGERVDSGRRRRMDAGFCGRARRLFPAGAHDDQVDAMTQALRYLRSHGLAVWEALADD